jgi:TldD protein
VPEIDPEFLALPMRRLADAALSRARELGVQHADFRLERIRGQDLMLRDGRVDSATDGVTQGSPSGWCTRGRGASRPAST